MATFVLTMVNGPDYDRSRSRREQRGWDEHAEFMDGLQPWTIWLDSRVPG